MPKQSTRAWIYRIATAVVPILIVYGVIAESDASVWLGLAGAVLNIGERALYLANTPAHDK
ncbi:phage holin [Salininema proteolyticum]|uniref:Holin n=1 Tax=Salininema proteolyticum TaxID=1607685 RepID=A0ABV8TXM9_9ACTN